MSQDLVRLRRATCFSDSKGLRALRFVAMSPRAGTPLMLDIAATEHGAAQLLTDGVAPADEDGARRLGAGYPAGKVRSDREKHFPLEALPRR